MHDIDNLRPASVSVGQSRQHKRLEQDSLALHSDNGRIGHNNRHLSLLLLQQRTQEIKTVKRKSIDVPSQQYMIHDLYLHNIFILDK